MVLSVKTLSTVSSNMYNKSNEGSAICSSKIAGMSVHTHSTICISKRLMLMYGLITIKIMIIPTNLMINTKIKLIKSCRWASSSIKGLFAS